MPAYLCIGGPVHGQVKSFPGQVSRYAVPEVDRFVGTARISGGDELAHSVNVRQSIYTVKEIELHEQRTEPSTGEAMDVTVRVSARVRLLAHESILTTEELSAYFRKLRPNAILGGVSHVTRRMELLKASVWG